jgi:hypothetical protein
LADEVNAWSGYERYKAAAADGGAVVVGSRWLLTPQNRDALRSVGVVSTEAMARAIQASDEVPVEGETLKLKEARKRFEEYVRKKIRPIELRGVLGPSGPFEDIDPADVEIGKLDILAEELRVFHNNKVLRTYYQVRCYEADVDRCVAELRSGTELNRQKRTSDADFAQFTKDYKAGRGQQTAKAFIQAAEAAGINRPRKDLRTALPPTPRGRPKKSPK